MAHPSGGTQSWECPAPQRLGWQGLGELLSCVLFFEAGDEWQLLGAARPGPGRGASRCVRSGSCDSGLRGEATGSQLSGERGSVGENWILRSWSWEGVRGGRRQGPGCPSDHGQPSVYPRLVGAGPRAVGLTVGACAVRLPPAWRWAAAARVTQGHPPGGWELAREGMPVG